jgi:hypothetical protein
MTFLYADGSPHSSFNENSLVVRLDLGTHRVLLMGDAEAGGRKAPATTPAADSIEGKLLACCVADVKADVLIVGHHGSKTSSRAAFLSKVGAHLFVISAGPTKYASVTLPDQEIVDEVEALGDLFRTDLDDDACAESTVKVGPDNDGKAGRLRQRPRQDSSERTGLCGVPAGDGLTVIPRQDAGYSHWPTPSQH